MNEFLPHKCDRSRLGHSVFTERPNVPHSRTYFFSRSLSHLTFHLPSHFLQLWLLSFSSDPFISNFVHKFLHIRRSPRWMINHWGLNGSDMTDLQIAAWMTAHIRTGEEGRKGLVNIHRSAFPPRTGTPGNAHTRTRTSDTDSFGRTACVRVCVCVYTTNVGVTLDSDHIAMLRLAQRCVHLRHLAKVKSFVSQHHVGILIQNFTATRLDSLHALSIGLGQTFLPAAGPKSSCPSFKWYLKKPEHISPVVASLHWLPVGFLRFLLFLNIFVILP